jgi:molybdenum cofactor cytidylyltransferase
MGQTKQLVSWKTSAGRKPLIVAAYDVIQPVCNEIVVVLGHEADTVAAAFGNRPFHRVETNPDSEMFESIRAGVSAALAMNNDATIILQPGDHPQVQLATLESLAAESARRPHVAVMPEYELRGGHPVFIPSNIAKMLIQAKPRGGLRGFWTQRAEICHRLPVNDPGVVLDIDTPDQLRR